MPTHTRTVGNDRESLVSNLRFRDGFGPNAINPNIEAPNHFIIETAVYVAVKLDRSVVEPIPTCHRDSDRAPRTLDDRLGDLTGRF